MEELRRDNHRLKNQIEDLKRDKVMYLKLVLLSAILTLFLALMNGWAHYRGLVITQFTIGHLITNYG